MLAMFTAVHGKFREMGENDCIIYHVSVPVVSKLDQNNP